MFDEPCSGRSGTFDWGGAQFAFSTMMQQSPCLTTLWVRGLHWPDCCRCDGTHVPISVGTGHFGGRFMLANADFWTHAVDIAGLTAILDTWLTTGDLPDWRTGGTD